MIGYLQETVVAKNTRGSKEFTREQRLIKENRQLKRELAHLRKQITRIDVDRFETIKEMVTDYQEAERLQENLGNPNSNIEALKKQWECRDCGTGTLEISLYSKMGQTFYYRKCNNCPKRTKGQRYDSNSVKGIIKK